MAGWLAGWLDGWINKMQENRTENLMLSFIFIIVFFVGFTVTLLTRVLLTLKKRFAVSRQWIIQRLQHLGKPTNITNNNLNLICYLNRIRFTSTRCYNDLACSFYQLLVIDKCLWYICKQYVIDFFYLKKNGLLVKISLSQNHFCVFPMLK